MERENKNIALLGKEKKNAFGGEVGRRRGGGGGGRSYQRDCNTVPQISLSFFQYFFF